jgi:hypothetical protein
MVQAPRNLSDLISEIPSSTQERVRKGFGVGAKLSEDLRNKFITTFRNAFESGAAAVDLEQFAEEAQITPSESSSLVAALSIVAGAFAQCTATPEEFIQNAKGKLFEPSNEGAALEIARSVTSQRTQLERAFELRSLAVETLPTLVSFDVTVDLRFRFEKNQIKDAIPVALFHLDTDSKPEIWFQATIGDIEAMSAKLADAKAKMEEAIRFFDKARMTPKK